ncbi:MAG: helix-turn-helix transcriptional regulator [Candidatus Kapabacteria bacterium]|nr:helix-turn-helix transcriptional regulator [Candidatus Kapabacteria bacterium]
MIRSRLRLLIAQKSMQDRRSYSVRAVIRASGASRATVEGLYRETLKRLPLADLEKLCRWFSCTPNDLLWVSDSAEADG